VSSTQPQLRFYLANIYGKADSLSVDIGTGNAKVEGFEPAAPDFCRAGVRSPTTSASP